MDASGLRGVEGAIPLHLSWRNGSRSRGPGRPERRWAFGGGVPVGAERDPLSVSAGRSPKRHVPAGPTPQDNIKIVRNIFDAWNKHDSDRYVKLLDEKHVVESDTIPAALTGREAGRQFMEMYVSAFPDLNRRMTTEQVSRKGRDATASPKANIGFNLARHRPSRRL